MVEPPFDHRDGRPDMETTPMVDKRWIESSLATLEQLERERDHLVERLDRESNPDALLRITTLLRQVDDEISRLYEMLEAVADNADNAPPTASTGSRLPESRPAGPIRPPTTPRAIGGDSVVVDLSDLVGPAKARPNLPRGREPARPAGPATRHGNSPPGRPAGMTQRVTRNSMLSAQPPDQLRRRPAVAAVSPRRPRPLAAGLAVAATTSQMQKRGSGGQRLDGRRAGGGSAPEERGEFGPLVGSSSPRRMTRETAARRAISALVAKLKGAAHTAQAQLTELRQIAAVEGRAMAQQTADARARAKSAEQAAKAAAAEAERLANRAERARATATAAATAQREAAAASARDIAAADAAFSRARRAAQAAEAHPDRLLALAAVQRALAPFPPETVASGSSERRLRPSASRT
ncbi:MAG: hypothetical protein B7733_02905 [Myxococcales bacterium FL481]|nr:MAG: hypothetical protein B7733_02905 [Myxococcales bacterium FL481]